MYAKSIKISKTCFIYKKMKRDYTEKTRSVRYFSDITCTQVSQFGASAQDKIHPKFVIEALAQALRYASVPPLEAKSSRSVDVGGPVHGSPAASTR